MGAKRRERIDYNDEQLGGALEQAERLVCKVCSEKGGKFEPPRYSFHFYHSWIRIPNFEVGGKARGIGLW